MTRIRVLNGDDKYQKTLIAARFPRDVLIFQSFDLTIPI